MAAEKYPKLQQSKEALQQSAKLADVTTQKTAKVPLLTTRGGSAISSAPPKAPAPSGAKDLWLTFFFDGTGNNLEADQGTDEHSNVARLYRAHEEDDEEKGVFRVYIPGIGTRFAEIGDPGDEMTGNGFGARGEARLQWAMGESDPLPVRAREAVPSATRLPRARLASDECGVPVTSAGEPRRQSPTAEEEISIGSWIGHATGRTDFS
jgi:hypothetical protein